MKRIFILLLCLGLIGLTACQKTVQPEKAESTKKTEKTQKVKAEKSTGEAFETEGAAMEESVVKPTPPTLEDVGSPDEVAVIETSKGDIVLEFYPDIAPMHVANFKKLAKSGFYDGTTFHRVLPGFVLQGGDPNSKDDNPNNDGMGGPGYNVNAEFSDRPHVKGTLSMARSRHPNSAGSQFFICLDRTQHLDNQYTVFGGTVKGMDVVEAIGKLKRDPSKEEDRLKPAVVMKKVRIVKKSEVGL